MISAINGEREIRAYHYTHRKNYKAITEDSSGLVAKKKLKSELQSCVWLDRGGDFWGALADLPSEFDEPVIFAFLEPEPESWRHNSEFPLAWSSVMAKVTMPPFAWDYTEAEEVWVPEDLVMVSFAVQPEDNAYILDRVFPLREGNPRENFDKYFASRVPVADYDGSYSLPELVLWRDRVDSDRLKLEEVNPSLQEEIRKLLIIRKIDRLMPQLLKGFRGDPIVLRNKIVGFLTE